MKPETQTTVSLELVFQQKCYYHKLKSTIELSKTFKKGNKVDQSN
jgi:hypothetical protein